MRGILLCVLAMSVTALDEGWSPNIVLFLADDLGYGDLGCYGGRSSTPNLDRLAREGMRFTDYYVAQPVCSASRAALLTGCYPNRIGIEGALGPGSRMAIGEDETTIAELLRERGYATAIYGKWHLGHREPSLPRHHGFDDYFGLPYSNDMWPHHPTIAFPDLPLVDGTAIVARNPDQRKLTRWSTEKAVAFVGENRDRPFFLYVPYTMPHVPLHASAAFEGSTGKGLYADVLAEMDASIGTVLGEIERQGLRERTIVIFSSDNGPWLSYGEHAGSTGGLREGKASTFEGGVRVPCLVRWPGVVAPGSTSHEPVMSIDWYPTLARAAGAKVPRAIDGCDLTAILKSEPDATRGEPLLFYWRGGLEAIRWGRWKLHFPHEYETIGNRVATGGHPVEYHKARIGKELFDLEADPGETMDVAARHSHVIERLERVAEKARADLGDTETHRNGAGLRSPAYFPSN